MQNDRRCPACDEGTLSVFFRLEDVPVFCNVLWGTPEQARGAPRGGIELGFCSGCGLIYNVAFDPGRITYTPDYENSLHFSERFQEYARALARRLVEKHSLQGKNVLEIGCGKGEFLALLCELGAARGIGFDASYDPEQAPVAETHDITVIRDEFSEAAAEHAADMICCRHVLEHVPRPGEFLQTVRAAAGGRGDVAFYFEVPNVLFTLEELGIWDVIYEHCSYFSAPSLVRLLRESGFAPSEVSTAYGSQFLCLDGLVGGRGQPPAGADPEALPRLSDLVDRFSRHYENKVAQWRRELQELEASGKRVFLWGAGSKGVTFLNTIPEASAVEAVVDVNPRKHGKHVPGTGQEVITPRELSRRRVDAVLVMNPLYRDEIGRTVAALGLSTEILVA